MIYIGSFDEKSLMVYTLVVLFDVFSNFLYQPFISKNLHHISIFLVNLDITMPIKYHSLLKWISPEITV